MVAQNDDNTLILLWIKSVLYSLVLILMSTLIILAPKNVFDIETPYLLATSMALTGDENLLLYDYMVYSTEERFEKGLVDDVELVKVDFIERNEIFAVKVYGENEKIEINDDYIFIISPNTPELNIEYYLVKNLEVDGINLPCRTFVMLFKDISKLINNIYIALLFVFSISVFLPISFKVIQSITKLVKKQKDFVR